MSRSIFRDLSRRQFMNRLSLAGAGLFLPFLRTLEARAQGAAGTAPKRLVVIALQHGWQRIWHPEVTKEPVTLNGPMKNNGQLNYSDSFTFQHSFAPLNEIKNKVAFIDGLRPGPFWGNFHDVNYSNILTCAVPHGEGDSGVFPLPQNESFDNYFARSFGVNALRVNAGYASFGVQYHPLSWDQGINRLPYHVTPAAAFAEVSGALASASGDAAQAARARAEAIRSKLVLDEVQNDIQRIEKELSGDAKVAFQRYLDLLTALQRRIATPIEASTVANVPIPGVPGANPTLMKSVADYYGILVATTALATHPVAVLGLGQANADAFPWRDSAGGSRIGQVGVEPQGDFHHKIAHYKTSFIETPGQFESEAVMGWAAWNMQQVVSFAKQLDALTDVDGKTVLDNTLIVCIGEIGDGQHDVRHWGVPLIGGGWGKVTGNRYYKLPTFEVLNRQGFLWAAPDRAGNLHENTVNYGKPVAIHTLSDLWSTIADLAGKPTPRWGYQIYNQGKLKI